MESVGDLAGSVTFDCGRHRRAGPGTAGRPHVFAVRTVFHPNLLPTATDRPCGVFTLGGMFRVRDPKESGPYR